MKIKAIIHDWDDTITNAFETYTQFYVDLGEHYGLGEVSIEDIRRNWGNPIPVIVNGIWPDLGQEEADKITHEFIRGFKKWRKSYDAEVFPGVKNTFENLHKNNIKLGTISSGHRPAIEKIYAEQIYNGKNFHEFLFDHKDLGTAKPDPKVFDRPFEILKQYGILEKDTLYVGDSFQDYEAAKNRGLRFVAVTTGVKSKGDFMEQGLEEKNILDSFNSLVKII